MRNKMVVFAAAMLITMWVSTGEGSTLCGQGMLPLQKLYMDAVRGERQVEAEAKLVNESLRIVSCLNKEGLLPGKPSVKGRFGIVLDLLSILRDRSQLRVSTPEEITRFTRLLSAEGGPR